MPWYNALFALRQSITIVFLTSGIWICEPGTWNGIPSLFDKYNVGPRHPLLFLMGASKLRYNYLQTHSAVFFLTRPLLINRSISTSVAVFHRRKSGE
jgi:hypothetical protein